MPFMYILVCSDGSYYTGSTLDLEKRLWQHQNGYGANHTKKHQPVKLVYSEEFDRIEDAYLREKQIQGWKREKKKALIEGNFEKLIVSSKNRSQATSPLSNAASTSSATEFDKLSHRSVRNDAQGRQETRNQEPAPKPTLGHNKAPEHNPPPVPNPPPEHNPPSEHNPPPKHNPPPELVEGEYERRNGIHGGKRRNTS